MENWESSARRQKESSDKFLGKCFNYFMIPNKNIIVVIFVCLLLWTVWMKNTIILWIIIAAHSYVTMFTFAYVGLFAFTKDCLHSVSLFCWRLQPSSNVMQNNWSRSAIWTQIWEWNMWMKWVIKAIPIHVLRISIRIKSNYIKYEY